MESRTRAFNAYGGLPAVPIILCGAKECAGIGRSGVISGVYWCRRWTQLSDFLKIPGGGDSYLEIACGLSRERVILQMLHWFSKTKENSNDRHACFLPPPLDRPCAIVCRKDEACAYATYSSDYSKVVRPLPASSRCRAAESLAAARLVYARGALLALPSSDDC